MIQHLSLSQSLLAGITILGQSILSPPGMESAMHHEKRQILLPNLCLLSLVSCDCLHNCRWTDIIPPAATVLQSLVLREGCDLTPLLL